MLRGRLLALVSDRREYKKFHQVFDLSGFGLMVRAMLLIRCYPLSRFESEGAFKRRLGLGLEERSSGQIEGFKSSGYSIAKSELYNWSRTTNCGQKKIDLSSCSRSAGQV
ncbi:MAG: hypothetical protein F6K40_33165 [Okeania sp. SIO3I5]|uniref:hypothetical protein n=1 Tax=Okeania sp. SIO3I5 TaxID=2607805 RepID=UPI0013B7F0DE|nr:hypothetical protein [Okeania sp. SIO3I5]NEQ40812.1 hypothetical protein [Okeania sp. SIO3I5]